MSDDAPGSPMWFRLRGENVVHISSKDNGARIVIKVGREFEGPPREIVNLRAEAFAGWLGLRLAHVETGDPIEPWPPEEVAKWDKTR